VIHSFQGTCLRKRLSTEADVNRKKKRGGGGGKRLKSVD